MKTPDLKSLVIALASAGTILVAHAATDARSTLSGSERKFITEAASGGLAEVEMGRLAADKAQNAEVKQFGQRMAQDHGKANDELKQLASSKGVDVPAAPDKKHQSKMDKLSKASGDKFDKDYMKDMVSDHKHDVSEFQKMAKGAKDPDVKAFAAKTLPTLQEHLKMAQATDDAVKHGNSSKSSKVSTTGGRSSGSNEGMTAGGGTSSGGSTQAASNGGATHSGDRNPSSSNPTGNTTK